MSQEGRATIRGTLGAGDGPITIADYERSWPRAYIAECKRLAALLPGVQIHHIGSTAVPGLAAKPVIDMIALVEDLDETADLLIQRAGYHLPARFNDGLLHRRYLCYPSVSYRTHHLHLVDAREDLDACLRFRDTLTRDPNLALAYAALKHSLAARFRRDRAGYTMAKGTFIKEALSEWAVSQENVEVVRRAVAAFNDRDVASFAALTTPDFEWSPSMSPIEHETFLGPDGIRKYFDALSAAWEHFHVQPGAMRRHAAGVLLLGQLEGRGRGSGALVDAPLGMAFDLRDGMISGIRGYLDHAVALKAVGLEE
jgi:GrpB-like predicted nucleotidyltransferase (UPF0157 family)/ketosteroid isomerase-like protein